MNEKKVFIIIISILSCTAAILVGLAVYGKISKNGALNFGGDLKTEAIDAYEELDLPVLYKEGLFLNTDDDFEITKQGNLKNFGDENVYKINIGYLDFGDTEADKVIIDGIAAEDCGAEIKMYAGKSKKPFLEASLPETDLDLLDVSSDECIFDISDAGIKGKKLIKIEISFEADAKDKAFELRTIEFKTAAIPTLYFSLNEEYGTIEDMNADKENSCTGSLFISIPAGYEAEYTDSRLEDFECEIDTIHGRGNSTWDCDKKPYTMKLVNKENLLGMGSAKKWVLLANYYDKSLMRDKLAYNLACDMGMDYAAQSAFVDVVMNDRYVGSYLLSEKIEVKKNRVEIQDLDDYPRESDEDIINGGYLIQLKPYDRVDDDEMYFDAYRVDKAMVIESPSFDGGYNRAQVHYIEDYYHRFEEALYSYDFCNSEGERYTDLIDIDSFVDFYIIHELFKNNDALYASTFFYKDRDAKMCIGPVWDFDLSAGTYSCNWTEYPEGFFINGQYIFERLVKDPEFVQKVIERYYEIHDDITKMYSDDNENAISDIRRYADALDISQKMNFDKWGMGNRGWDAVLGQGSYEAEVEYLEDWMEKRVEWLDDNIESLMPE